MIDHLWERYEEGDLEAVYVGSNDARAFLDPLAELADRDIGVHVLGFAELAGGLSTASHVRLHRPRVDRRACSPNLCPA